MKYMPTTIVVLLFLLGVIATLNGILLRDVTGFITGLSLVVISLVEIIDRIISG